MQHIINQTTTKSPMRLRHWYDTLGLISGVGLVWLIICLLLPVAYDDTNAQELRTAATTDSIALAITEAAAIDVTPTATGQFGKTTTRVSVTTSSNAGYKLYLNTADTTNAMYNVNGNSIAAINAVNGAISEAEFLANEWGYALTKEADSTLQYQAMPLTATMVEESTENAGTYDLSFGAMVDTALPAGQYVNNVLVSAVANPSYVTGLMSLTYMQDMTSSICADTKGTDGGSNKDTAGSYIITPGSEPTKQLIDIRDGKEYWVAKLADGNCWMTQNLAYDLVKGKVLTPSDSDVSEEWVVPTGTETEVPTANPDANKDYASTRSWDLGSYVLVTFDNANGCVAPGQTDTNVSLMTGQTLAQCSNMQDVANWQPTFEAKSGIWQNQEYDQISVNPVEKTYDAHYLFGNRYLWTAATAASGVGLLSTGTSEVKQLKDASSSICPKGWKLPTSGQNLVANGQVFDRQGSFYRLFRAYGYPSTTGYSFSGISNGSSARFLTGEFQDLDRRPFYFIRGGVISHGQGQAYFIGGNGRYISSTVGTTINTLFGYNLVAEAFYPASSTINRVHGFAVRCVAR